MDIWVEKYRPTKIEDLVTTNVNLKKFKEYIKTKSIPHLLFSGPPGNGKTSSAKILSKEITDDILYINASDESSVDTIRNKVKDFCCTISLSGGLKVIILDECDGLNDSSQRILRNIMEYYAETCRFILTCNYETRVIDPIKSRCQKFEFTQSEPKEIAQRCLYILNEEGIKCEDCNKQIVKLVKCFYPDIRKIINNLQKCSVDGAFSFTDNVVSSSDDNEKMLSLIKQGDIKTIRKELLGLGADYLSFYRYLFDNAKQLSIENSASIMLEISEHLYRHSIVLDQEINFVACLLKVYQNI